MLSSSITTNYRINGTQITVYVTENVTCYENIYSILQYEKFAAGTNKDTYI
jgi:hypothetical protein